MPESSDIVATIKARASAALERNSALCSERDRLVRAGKYGAGLALSSEIHRMRQLHSYCLQRLKALADEGDLVIGKDEAATFRGDSK